MKVACLRPASEFIPEAEFKPGLLIFKLNLLATILHQISFHLSLYHRESIWNKMGCHLVEHLNGTKNSSHLVAVHPWLLGLCITTLAHGQEFLVACNWQAALSREKRGCVGDPVMVKRWTVNVIKWILRNSLYRLYMGTTHFKRMFSSLCASLYVITAWSVWY